MARLQEIGHSLDIRTDQKLIAAAQGQHATIGCDHDDIDLHLADPVNVAQRPAEATDRVTATRWERDLIIGRLNRTAIGTLAKRVTGTTMLIHLPNGYKPEQVRGR